MDDRVGRYPWSSWAAAWNLQHHPQDRLKERLSGFRNGFPLRIINVGITGSGFKAGSEVSVTVGFPLAEAAALDAFARDTRLEELPGWKKRRDKPGELRNLRVEDRMLTWTPHFSFRLTPQSAELAKWIDKLLVALSRHVRSYDRRCVDCGAEAASILFCDRVPLPFCENCRQRRLQRLTNARAELDFRREADPPQPRPLRGVLAGLVTMMVMLFCWWLFSSADGRVNLLVPFFTGCLVVGFSLTYWKEPSGGAMVGASLLTAVSVMAGATVAMWRQSVPPGLQTAGFPLAIRLAWQEVWEHPGYIAVQLVVAGFGGLLGFVAALNAWGTAIQAGLPQIEEP